MRHGRYSRTRSDYNLAFLFPSLAKEWNFAKNGNLRPDDMFPKSERKVWWLCPKGHDYEARVTHRARGHGCPYCCGYRVHKDNSVAGVFPNLVKEWDAEKNGGKSPNDYTYGSTVGIWWKCVNGHSWNAPINSRTNMMSGCPFCRKRCSTTELRVFSEIRSIFGDAVWGYKLNGVECDVFIPSIRLGIEIDGSYWHRNKFRSDTKKNRFFKKHGIVIVRLREGPLKPIDRRNDILHGVKEDRLEVVKRLIRKIEKMRGIKTAYCKSKCFVNNDLFLKMMSDTVMPRKNLLDVFPEIAKRWHPSKNGSIKPQNVSPKSNRKIWWICERGHEWMAKVCDMTRVRAGSTGGCNLCYGRSKI